MVNEVLKSAATDKLVLVVDDEKFVRETLVRAMSHENIKCLEAGSEKEALEILGNHAIALMLLDWSLRAEKDTSGAEVLFQAKKHHPETSVIVMSGGDMDVRTDAYAKQADGFLAKPFAITVVVNAVKQALKRIAEKPVMFLPSQDDQIAPLEKVKNIYIRHVVKLLDGNISAAAEKLDVHRQTVANALED